MLKKTLATSIVILLLSSLVLGFQEAEAWPTFNSPEGRFSVVMPTKPRVEVKDVDSAVGKLTLYSYSSSTAAVFLLVSFGDYPKEPADAAHKEDVLDGVRDGVLKGLGAELLSEERITIGINPGRAFVAKKTDKDSELVFHWRVFLVGRRLYQLGVVMQKQNAETPDTTKFLKSFQLTS
jgi:hypothetical protein